MAGGEANRGKIAEKARLVGLRDRRHVLLLVLILTVVAAALGGVAILILYETAFDQERERLSDLARSQAVVIEALTINLQRSGMAPAEAREVALRLEREARSRALGFRETGEFALAERQDDTIVYRIRDRATPIDSALVLPLVDPDGGIGGGAGEPMRRALAGQRGTVVARDYRGVHVLAAYEPLPLLGAGIVAKIDMAELRRPFISAAGAIGMLGLVLVALGTTLFFRVTEPMLGQLRDKERRYRHLIDQMDQGVIVLRAVDDGRDFVIRDVNPACEAIEQCSRAHLIGRRMSEALPRASAVTGIIDLCHGVWRTGVAESVRDTAYADDRHAGWRDYRIYRLPDGDVVCLFEDVTGRHATEERLKQTQKLEVLGQLTGGIAHDFNNVLAIVIGNLQLLEERAGEREDKDLLGDALWAAGRGAELTHQLLAYARQQPLDPRPIDVNHLIRGMTDLLRRTLHASISIRERLGDDLWPTMIDRIQLESAIVNLIVNARDAMPSGGELTIETINTRLDEGEKMAGTEPVVAGEYVMVAVRDTGVGMTPEVAERAFEPFYTTKGPGRGSGLGLSHGLRLRQAVGRPCPGGEQGGRRNVGRAVSAARACRLCRRAGGGDWPGTTAAGPAASFRRTGADDQSRRVTV